MTEENVVDLDQVDPRVAEAAALEAKREAFLAKVADPPDNVAVAMEKEAAAAEAEAPKARTTSSTSGEGSPRSTLKVSQSSEPSKTPAKTPASAEPSTGTTPESSVDAVLAALKAGDLDAVAELTGADPADFDEKSTRWAARNRREHGLRAEVARVEAEAKQVLEQFGPIGQHLEAFDRTRDYAAIRNLVEYATGESWAAAAPKLGLAAPTSALAARPAPPDRALLEAIRDDVPDDHQVRVLPGWEHRVAEVLRENIDDRTGDPTISFKQAAARAVRRAKDEHAKLAPVFGGAAPAARGPAPSTPQRAEAAAPASRRRLTREEWLAKFGK